ncbi:OLC1v1002846C2 [Oldenlandia corymbosa var. corymbosa]|uniref:OLC1v1002846C2 n=1 Tax=Oldenlandia corymbosa var. corymbosa TaxID=529605 RepID=A0AAV1D8P8_OLDCO|nr:OLC1v1002846C2 [Oldenlandia corymbosa var. corymbosa]
MAVPSNRSPSPLASRRMCQSRISTESNSAARRSFSGNGFIRPSALANPRNLNPITPANSPAGIVRRNSLSNLQGCEEKENDKDQNLKPVDTAAKSSGTGSKNFMAPTISAASKFTPSPRKKVLVERNDPVRTSISLSEGKATFFSSISSESLGDLERKDGECGGNMESSIRNPDQKDAVLEVPRVSKSSKRVTFLESSSGSDVFTGFKLETATVSSTDCADVDSASKSTISCFSASPVIAPLDADPSLPPYDPKTNFLSPRPQFLHYRPNPRIEVLLNKEKELEFGKPKRLEDNFMLDLLSESFSDSEGTGESNSEDSQKGSEDSSSSENLIPEATEDELPVSESVDASIHVLSESVVEGKGDDEISSIPISHGISEEHLEQEKEDDAVVHIGRPKSGSFRVLKYVSLLLVLLVTCVSIGVIITPSMDTLGIESLKSSKFPDTSEIGLLAKENLNHLGSRFQKYTLDSISHFSLLIYKFGGGDNFDHIQFINLTSIEDNAVCLEDLQRNLPLIEDLKEEVTEEEEEEEEMEAEYVEEPTHQDMVSDDSFECDLDDASDLVGNEELVTAPVSLPHASLSQSSETLCGVEESSSYVVTEMKAQEGDSENEEVVLLPLTSAVIVSETSDPERTETDAVEADLSHSSMTELESSPTETTAPSILEDVAFEIFRGLSLQTLGSLSVIGVALLVSILVAAAFMSWKKNTSGNQNVVGGSMKQAEKMFQYRAVHQTFTSDVDVGEEPCSSEMSSYRTRNSASSRKDRVVANEVQSEHWNSRKYTSKRESLASSSEFSTDVSASYGSFTTYEKIPMKHVSYIQQCPNLYISGFNCSL